MGYKVAVDYAFGFLVAVFFHLSVGDAVSDVHYSVLNSVESRGFFKGGFKFVLNYWIGRNGFGDFLV